MTNYQLGLIIGNMYICGSFLEKETLSRTMMIIIGAAWLVSAGVLP